MPCLSSRRLLAKPTHRGWYGHMRCAACTFLLHALFATRSLCSSSVKPDVAKRLSASYLQRRFRSSWIFGGMMRRCDGSSPGAMARWAASLLFFGGLGTAAGCDPIAPLETSVGTVIAVRGSTTVGEEPGGP